MLYLGSFGRMVGIKCPTAQRVATADRYLFATTLGGVVKAQAGPVGRRTWDISWGPLSAPSDVGTLMDFANGAWGPGPFWFIPADAPVVNLLPPAVASCDPATVVLSGGSQVLGTPPLELGVDGFAARSIWKHAGVRLFFAQHVPVVPGRPVTASAWVAGGGRVRLELFDAAGAFVSATESQALTQPVGRLSVTTIVPDAVVSARLVVTEGSTHVARPAMTWTDQPYEWGDGQGCPKAVVHSVSRDLVKAWDDPRTGRWSEVSFAVQELG